MSFYLTSLDIKKKEKTKKTGVQALSKTHTITSEKDVIQNQKSPLIESKQTNNQTQVTQNPNTSLNSMNKWTSIIGQIKSSQQNDSRQFIHYIDEQIKKQRLNFFNQRDCQQAYASHQSLAKQKSCEKQPSFLDNLNVISQINKQLSQKLNEIVYQNQKMREKIKILKNYALEVHEDLIQQQHEEKEILIKVKFLNQNKQEVEEKLLVEVEYVQWQANSHDYMYKVRRVKFVFRTMQKLPKLTLQKIQTYYIR